jgi:hypothetical protein
MTRSEAWMLLLAGTDTLARRRIGDMHEQLTETVTEFHNDAAQQAVDLRAPAERDLGLALFDALADVLTNVVLADDNVVEKVAGEAITAFRDVLVAGIRDAGQQAVATSYEQAHDQLAHALRDLVVGTRSSAIQAWHRADALLPQSLDAFFAAHPDYRHHEFGEDAPQWAAWFCDQIGILDAAVANPAAAVTEALWRAFHADYYRLSAQVCWHERNVLEQVEFLHDMDPGQRDPFLQLMGTPNLPGWHYAVALWDSDRMAAVQEIPLLPLD